MVCCKTIFKNCPKYSAKPNQFCILILFRPRTYFLNLLHESHKRLSSCFLILHAIDLRILFTVGNVDRGIGRYSGRYSGRHSGRQSVDTRSTVGRYSVDNRSIVGRQSVDTRSTVGRQSVDIAVDSRSTVCR